MTLTKERQHSLLIIILSLLRTLFRSAIMLRWTKNIQKNIPCIHIAWGIFCKILSIPQNIVMDLNNVMQGGSIAGRV